jgi:hypothetical protein
MVARRALGTLTVLLVSGLLAACAGSGDKKPSPDIDDMLSQLTEQNGRACFYISDVEGFGTLEDGLVSVSTRFNKHYYLVTTAFSCAWLSSSFQMGFQGPGGQVCGGGASNLVSEGHTCPVGRVFEFPSREDAMRAWELAKAKREVQQQYQVPGK